VLVAVSEAQARGIINAVLVGNAQAIQRMAREHHLELDAMRIVDEPDDAAAADKAMQIVAEGEAKVAIKGQVADPPFFSVRPCGARPDCRTERLISHVGVFEVPPGPTAVHHRCGVVLFPTLEQKIEIVSNGIAVARG